MHKQKWVCFWDKQHVLKSIVTQLSLKFRLSSHENGDRDYIVKGEIFSINLEILTPVKFKY